MVAYLFFMVRETAPFDMTSRISKIVEVCSDVLFDFLVMLVRVVDAVAHSSTWRGCPSTWCWSAKQLRLGRRLDLGTVDQRIELIE